MANKVFGLIIFLVLGQITLSDKAFALLSAHPSELYDRGVRILDSYRGDPSALYEAQKCFADLIQKYPDSPYGYLGMSRVQKINAYLYDNRYNMSKIRDEVLPFAIKALELGPSIRDVHEHYSALENIYENFYTNQKEAQQALLAFPDRADTYLIIGMFFGDQGEHEKAVEFYKAALEMEPSADLSLRILKRIGLLYLNNFKQTDKAVEYFQQAMAISPNSAINNENMGRAYLEMKNYRRAIDRLTKAMNALPNSYTEYHLLQAKALLAEEQGKVKDAISLFESALIHNKHNIPLHFKLGNLYYNLANYEKAYPHFMRVINLEPQNPGAYYFAGRSAYSLGETDTAINYYKRYLQLDADSEEAAWIRKNVPEFSQK